MQHVLLREVGVLELFGGAPRHTDKLCLDLAIVCECEHRDTYS